MEQLGESIKDNTLKQSEINISSSIFTIYAYEELKEILDESKNVKFLFNGPTFIKKVESNQKEVKEFQIQMRQRKKNISEFPLEIGLKNNLDQNQIASRCHKFIKDKAEIISVINHGVITASNIYIKNANKNNMD